MNTVIIGYAIICIILHWICDFVLQQSDLGVDNEKDYKIDHCTYYFFSFSLLSILFGAFINCDPINLLYFVLLCTLSHTVVDYMLIPVLYKCKDKLNIKMLGLAWALDQVIHIMFILAGLVLFIVQ